MKRIGWQIHLGLLLVALSAFLYFLHYAVFHDAHHIFIYLVGDIAFVPVEVLLVTLVIHRLLSVREKRAMLHKLNMVIGTFFREMGTELLARLAQSDANSETITNDLVVSQEWTSKTFQEVRARMARHQPNIEMQAGSMEELRAFLQGKRDLLLRLLQNPNVLEHEAFTDLLWAVFHLADELAHRGDLEALPDSDRKHLAGDMERIYGHLIRQWTGYMKHLKEDYPYLFSLAMRTNPFDPAASPIVR